MPPAEPVTIAALPSSTPMSLPFGDFRFPDTSRDRREGAVGRACLLDVGEPADYRSGRDLWTNEDAHAEALENPELRPYIEECMPLLEGMPTQVKLRPVGGKVPSVWTPSA
jgi:hypothetical protein